MPAAYTFTISERPLASALEILRKLIDPEASPLAQIIVRQRFDKGDETASDLYLSTTVSELELRTPFSLDTKAVGTERAPIRTLWLQCVSPELERVTYNPTSSDFPLGIGLYDGPPSRTARRVLDMMQRYSWGYRIPLHDNPRIEAIDWASPPPSPKDLALSDQSREYLDRLVPELSSLAIEDLTEAVRVDLAELVVTQLMRDLEVYSVYMTESVARELPGREKIQQPTLWGTIEPPPPPWSKANLRERSHKPHAVGGVVTPPEVASDMVLTAIAAHHPAMVDFGDPAAGRGSFFAHLVAAVGETRIRSAIAVELDPNHAILSEHLWRAHGLTVVTGNFLESDIEPHSRSLIVANPPYLRSQELNLEATKPWRAAIKNELGLTLSGRCDLSVYLLLAADRWAKRGAVGAWLIPAEALQANYAIPLRQYLTEQVTLLRLHFFDNSRSLFRDARVSSVFLQFLYQRANQESQVVVSSGGTISTPTRKRILPRSQLYTTAKWRTLLDWDTQVTNLDQIEVGQVFRIRRGIATGANRVFVIDDEMRDLLRIPPDWVKPVLPQARHLNDSIIRADSTGLPKVEPRLWLIDIAAESTEILARSPRLWEYLARARQQVGSRRIVSSRALFYRQEQRPPAPFLFSYMSRISNARVGELPFFLNRSKAVNLNNYICLYPRYSLFEAADQGILDVHVLELLRRIQVNQLSQHGREYVDGLRKAEPLELSRFGFPEGDPLAKRLLETVQRTEQAKESRR